MSQYMNENSKKKWFITRGKCLPQLFLAAKQVGPKCLVKDTKRVKLNTLYEIIH